MKNLNNKNQKRKAPGTGGEGSYYRIVVRPKTEFTVFRYHDVGGKGHVQRLAGKRESGSWDTQAWLISKNDAHVDNEKLIPDTEDAKRVIATLHSEPKLIKTDVFQAKDRYNIPERLKPTPAQIRARSGNLRKARNTKSAM